MHRVGRWLQVDPSLVEVTTHPAVDDQPGSVGTHASAAGEWQPLDGGRGRLTIDGGLLDDPVALAATIAHELCHQLLLGPHLIDPAERDGEGLTDLLVIHLGLGIYTANAAFRFVASGPQFDRGPAGPYYFTRTERLGYLSPQI